MIAEAMQFWPLGIYVAAVAVLVGGMLLLSYVLGERHRDARGSGEEAQVRRRMTEQPYEGGIVSTGSARLRFSADFYLIAMFFVIFDLESVFIFAWAVVVRQAGWLGYVTVVIFAGILLASLAYLWRARALDWVQSDRKGEDT